MLCNKHKGLDLLVRWTPGHTGIARNEKADEEAKKAAREGSSTQNILPAPLRNASPRGKAAARQESKRKLNVTAQNLWKSSPRYANMERLYCYKCNKLIELR